jgi:hypothetical protein
MGITLPDTGRYLGIVPVVLDTGATRTTLTPEAVQGLIVAGHPPLVSLGTSTTGAVGGGVVSTTEMRVPRLRIGRAFDLVDWQVSVTGLPAGIYGLVGGDVLHQMHRVTICYDAQSSYLEGDILPGEAIQTA